MNSKVVITTDSPADLSAELETRYDIHVLPLYVNLGGKSYRDGIDITTPDVFRHYDETGELPTTSAIPIGDYETFFSSSVCHCHDFGALAPLGSTNGTAPFFAGANAPSMKASRKSSLPRSRNSSAKASNMASNAPSFRQRWNHLWQVWYGG